MKKLKYIKNLILFLLIIPTLIFAQVPQGVGYQGVATDALGIELINQSISIRASVISGSATGTIEWQETHNTSTDTFGLFNLTIGLGTSTGNGSQTSFADITWGANTHFLKIEMDVNGGTNYSHMGTNQMMSVPYALYAENANINYDTILTYYDTILAYLSNDSIFTNNFVSGCSSFGTPQNTFNFNWTSSSQSETYFEEAQEDGFFGGQMNCGTTYQGRFEVWGDTTSNSSIYNYNISNGVSTFLIPIKKGQFFKINGSCINVNFFIPLECGNSSSSTVDSSYIDSLVQFYSSGNEGGCDINLPEGIYGDPVIHDLHTSSYTVPAGKNLYLTNIYCIQASGETYIDGVIVSRGYNNVDANRGSKSFIASSGQIITTSVSYPGVNTISGFLVDANVIPVSQDLYSSSYTVPAGKKLYLTNIYCIQASGETYIDGVIVSRGYNNVDANRGSQAFILNSGQIITTSVSYLGVNTINGYLADENYFADCGGGGSSSSTVDSRLDFLIPYIGCTDSNACNYNNIALFNDSSCLGLAGCTDSLSLNYNSLATCDDGSCIPYVGMYNYGGVVFKVQSNIAYVINVDYELNVTNRGTTVSNLASSDTTGGFTDWLVPSPDNLVEVCNNKTLINSVCLSNGGLQFGTDQYVTSHSWCAYSNVYHNKFVGFTSCYIGTYNGNCVQTFKFRTYREHTF